MKNKHMPLPVFAILLSSTLLLQATAQVPADRPSPASAGDSEDLQSFEFEQADLDLVMSMYCEWTGKIYLKEDSVTASITVKADKLTTKESIEVIKAILAMNNIALVPMGEKFLKVIPANAPDLDGQGLPINMDPDHKYEKTDKLVTQIIQLQNAEIPEVENAVRQLMHSYGKILALQNSNSLMVTDTESNILRIREMIKFLDTATARIEPRIYQIKYAEATDIASKLEEIVTKAQGDQKKPATSPRQPTATRRTPSGVVRARPRKPAAPTRASISKTEGGSPPIIQGDVKVMADERTNIIIIFSQEENFAFFDKIIEVFDVEVEPAVNFEVINLEYADAVELSGTLNELVGAATGSKSSSKSRSKSGSNSRSSKPSKSPTKTRVTPNASQMNTSTISNLSRLSEKTKILADERTNSILLMGEKSDIAAIKSVIDSLDIMLEQVIIEAAIFEIGLGNELRHGIDWLYKGLNSSGQHEKIGAWDGSSLITNSVDKLVTGAFNYYQNLSGLDSQILINLAKTDQDARLISTPVIMTTDNTEATLSIGEQRPVVTSTDTYSSSVGGQRSNYEYKDIGIQLTVTPRINPQRFVVMELTQKADQIGTIVTIDNNEVPTILNREFEASIAVPDGGTVVLGGLMSSEMKDTVRKIPILGDIPLIGRYLFSSVTKVEDQRELIVLMTPYVMTNMDETQGQTDRLYKRTRLKQEDWGKGNWSESKLRQIPDQEEKE